MATTVATGAITAVGRLGFGVQQALDTRYAAFSLFLYIAIFGLYFAIYCSRVRFGSPALRASFLTNAAWTLAFFALLWAASYKENLGVLAVANGPMSAPFIESDFSVFKAIAEQSAFALYNVLIYLLAAQKKQLDTDLQVAEDVQRLADVDLVQDVVGQVRHQLHVQERLQGIGGARLRRHEADMRRGVDIVHGGAEVGRDHALVPTVAETVPQVRVRADVP